MGNIYKKLLKLVGLSNFFMLKLLANITLKTNFNYFTYNSYYNLFNIYLPTDRDRKIVRERINEKLNT